MTGSRAAISTAIGTPPVAWATAAAGDREWPLMSRGWGPRTGRPLPEAMVLKETRSNSQIPTLLPHRFPLNSHAFTSGEGLLGRDEIDAAIQTMSTSKARRVDFGGCGPSQPNDDGGLADAQAANPFRLPRLHPGIDRAAAPHSRIAATSQEPGTPAACRCHACRAE